MDLEAGRLAEDGAVRVRKVHQDEKRVRVRVRGRLRIKRLAEDGAARVRKVHQDAVGEEDEPEVLQLGLLAGLLGARLDFGVVRPELLLRKQGRRGRNT